MVKSVLIDDLKVGTFSWVRLLTVILTNSPIIRHLNNVSLRLEHRSADVCASQPGKNVNIVFVSEIFEILEENLNKLKPYGLKNRESSIKPSSVNARSAMLIDVKVRTFLEPLLEPVLKPLYNPMGLVFEADTHW